MSDRQVNLALGPETHNGAVSLIQIVAPFSSRLSRNQLADRVRTKGWNLGTAGLDAIIEEQSSGAHPLIFDRLLL
jgi:hypothetical protein